MARPILMRLSAITPSPTHRFIPASPLYRQRSRPCRRLTTLMRPSHPVRHFWPLRNQRFLCSRLRSGLLVERLGMQTRLTPWAFRRCLVLGGVECGVRCHHVRRTPQHCSMRLDGGNQQVRIARTPIIDLIVDHDLVLGLLQLHHLAELVRLAGLAFANDLGRWLEQTEYLAF